MGSEDKLKKQENMSRDGEMVRRANKKDGSRSGVQNRRKERLLVWLAALRPEALARHRPTSGFLCHVRIQSKVQKNERSQSCRESTSRMIAPTRVEYCNVIRQLHLPSDPLECDSYLAFYYCTSISRSSF